jgi:DNA invertase Pin-like site-specific DNA recombinase
VALAVHFYARISSKEQDPKSQVAAACARGILTANIHTEVASGARHERPVLTKLLAELEKGDTLVTFRLDRLGRSLAHLVRVLEELEARGIAFETLDGVSTKGATGKLVLHILGSVAQFERQLLIERTTAGLKAARAEGRTGGRRRKMTPKDITTARKHITVGKLKAREVAAMYGVSERSLWRNLRWATELEEVRTGWQGPDWTRPGPDWTARGLDWASRGRA